MASSTGCLRRSQENKTCRARWRERWRAGILFSEACHFDRGHGGVVPLVAVLAAGAGRRLLHGVCRENAESYGNIRFQRNLLQSACGLARHVIEMWRFPTDDRSQRDDGAIAPFAKVARMQG